MTTISTIQKDHHHMVRNQDIQKQYELRKKEILQKYATLDDYIRVHVLKYSKKKNSYNLYTAIKSEKSLPFAFVPNAFPYKVGTKIQHYTLFSEKPLSKQETTLLLEKLLPKDSTFTFFVNAIHKRSLPSLWHAQVFWHQKIHV